VGRLAGWVVEVGLVYLVLSFPTGRLTGRVDRALVWTAALVVAVLYLPTGLIADDYPAPSPYTGCAAGCPDNAFFLLGSEPGFVDSVLAPLRVVVTALLFFAVTGRLVQRFRGSTRLMQRTLEPVLTVAAGRCAVLALALVVRGVNPESSAVEALSWAIALAVPLLALGFLLGLVMRRLYAGTALQELGGRVRAEPAPHELRNALAETLGDPTLRLLFGTEARAGPGQVLTEVRDGERRVATIAHDEALCDERDFLDAVASYALIALKNQRLTAEVESSLREVQASRARIQATADRERRRIERDLHDGAQQRLVALRIKLELAEEEMQRDPREGLKKLHALGAEVDGTLEEIRALAHGVYPSLLGERGLAEALQAAALTTPIAARVEPDGVGRYPQAVESAVYFSCLEAMQNASKHARGARQIIISLKQDDALRFQVRDDGAGFDSALSTPGAGLTNMRDRLVAVGGELSVRSSGAGTVVTGRVPLQPVGPRPAPPA
jgi:signal transduction histidine kinase